MIVIGAGGFASELLQNFTDSKDLKELAFYDDLNTDVPALKFDKYPILTSEEEAKKYFLKTDRRFVLGLGNPELRLNLFEKFTSLGGELVSCTSDKSIIGTHNVELGVGCTILANAVVSNSAELGRGCLVYYGAIVTHDCKVNEFVELSPGATLLGNVEVGSFSTIGSNATILPNVRIGKNVTIGAGAVVTKNLPDDCVAAGVPARIIKMRNE